MKNNPWTMLSIPFLVSLSLSLHWGQPAFKVSSLGTGVNSPFLSPQPLLSQGCSSSMNSSHLFCVWENESELILPWLHPCQVFLIARKM